jgi:hypothetical protein
MNKEKILEKLYGDLEMCSDFNKGEETIEAFLRTVREIIDVNDASSLQYILPYFDDNCPYDGVFESIRVGIEHFPREDYVHELIKNIHLMNPKSFDFASTMLARLINDDESYGFVKKYVQLADQGMFLKVLSLIESEIDWHDRSRSEELRKMLDETP